MALLLFAGAMLHAHHRGYAACVGLPNQAALTRLPPNMFHAAGLVAARGARAHCVVVPGCLAAGLINVRVAARAVLQAAARAALQAALRAALQAVAPAGPRAAGRALAPAVAEQAGTSCPGQS